MLPPRGKTYPSAGKFWIQLSKAVTGTTYVAWIVIG